MLTVGDHRSRRLWSLWEMIILRPVELMNLVQLTLTTEVTVRNTSGPLPELVAKEIGEGTRTIEEIAQSLELPVTAATARNMLARADTAEKLRQAMLQLGNTLFMELERRKFYGPLERYTAYFEQQQLFGEGVFNAFPSANDDIYEAGTCLALERSTACVMHLMRVLECGLATLAKTLGVARQNDWGAYLRKTDGELDTRAKAAGVRSSDEQFYAEAAAYLDRLRRAFRNPTMHPEKTYSQERAEEILLAVKSFLAHLATRISEASLGDVELPA